MDIFKQTKNVSDLNPEKEIFFRIAKMQEELGEFATALLEFHHYKGRKDKSITEIAENMREEAADIMLVAYDLIHIIEMSEEELSKRIMGKLPKWVKGIDNFTKQTTNKSIW